MRRWRRKKRGERTGLPPLLVGSVGVGAAVGAEVGAEVGAAVEVPEDKKPTFTSRKFRKRLSLVYSFPAAFVLVLLAVLSAESTTAWNQEPSCLHIIGPPESV